MNRKLLVVSLLFVANCIFAQQRVSFWNSSSKGNKASLNTNLKLPEKDIYELNLVGLKRSLLNTPARSAVATNSTSILTLPIGNGQLEHFKVYENSILEPSLAAKYPEIKSYIGIGIENPTTSAYFSISPLGFKSMLLRADNSAVFIEPITTDLTTYTVYQKSDKINSFSHFECSVVEDVKNQTDTSVLRPNADDGTLRTFRLAMSVTGEYTTYFGGTKALALAAINNTMTRVNGVFEKDFSARMVLITNTDLVIYTNASTDPYSVASTGSGGAWNQELQTTLTNTIGSANYDIGHLFGASGGGGNAGCIGCVCKNPTSTTPLGKGSGYTSPSDNIPAGDNFDIDYVAHEMGHQFGANHTFSMNNEGSGVNVEPGSGSTIMGYAGITSQDIQAHSDAIFHAVSIQQVTNYIKTTTCQTNTATGNAVPTANAGGDYTIPKSTPFILTGSATDANGDALTYIWEQTDNAASSATGVNSAATATRTSGPTFRSYNVSNSPTRYFPRMESVLTGATTTAGAEINVEALSSVARNLNFRFTVRDNRAGGSANNSDDVLIAVNATAGPFLVTSPNTAVSYVGGSSQTITWNVAGTTANGVNCANVDILLSTNGGSSWTTVLTGTINDGSHAIVIPNSPSTTCRIMIKGSNHIFFDVSNTNFTITAGVAADTTAPSAPALVASGTTQTTTNLSWSGATDNVGVTGYDVFQGSTLITSTSNTTFAVTGLAASTTYTFSVKAKDAAGNTSVSSNIVSVTTSAPAGDSQAPTAPTNLTASGTTQTTTTLSWAASTDNVGVTGYDVFQGTTLLGNIAGTSASITSLTPSTVYTFTVRAKDAAGNISASSNTISITTLGNAVTYCTSQGNSTADEKIGKVVFKTISNTSTGTSGYENFTTISTNVVRGTTNTITITPSWTATKYQEGYAVFVDYNQDGDFSDAGETVFTKAASTTTPVSGSFTIPTTALIGATRMRVSMKYNGIPTSCEAFSYGQVEDYTINISTTARQEETVAAKTFEFTLYPNPVSGSILNVSDLKESSTYKMYNMVGQELGKGAVINNEISVDRLATGTYLLEISNKNGTLTKRFIKQ
jgi:chitodextrinase